MRASVKPYAGAPCIFCDDERLPPVALAVNRGHLPRYPKSLFRLPGLRIFSLPCSLGEVWKNGDGMDFGSLDEAIRNLVHCAPAGLILLRLNLDAPLWWEEEHPEELNRYFPGSGADAKEIFEQTFRRQVNDVETEHQSFASKRWREEAGEAFRKLMRHVRTSSYADRIIGYHVCAGWGNEWLYYGVFEGRFGDYSQPMVGAFREWLAARYRTDGALQKAWSDASLTLEAIQIPEPQKRRSASFFSLEDPVGDRPVLDYLECLSDVMADALLHFAAVAKEEAPELLCAAYYGYLAYGGMFPYTMQHAGHRALRRVLTSEDIDILAAPYGYNDRHPTGNCNFMSVVESVRRHGKVWMNEDDTRVGPDQKGLVRFGGAGQIESAIHLHRRNAAVSAAKGVGLWWIDFGQGWYDDERIVSNLADCVRLLDWGSAHKGPPLSEVAVVLDDRSALHEKLGDELSKPTITKQISRELCRFGAPYDLLHLDDVCPETCFYRLFIFLGVHHITTDQLERLHATVRRDRITSLWIFSPGVFGRDEAPLADPAKHIGEVTGIRTGIEPMMTDLSVRVTDLGHPITQHLPEPIRYGTDRAIGPVIYADDPNARVLGQVEYLHSLARPGLVAKEMEQFRSVYSSSPCLPAPLLRGIARWAGVHIYCGTGDVLHAGRGILALHAVSSGRKILCLPQAATVTEFFEGKIVSRDSDRIEFDLEAGHTAVFTISQFAERKGE